jgi:hypothetical protein
METIMDKLLAMLQETLKRIETLAKQISEFRTALNQTEVPKKFSDLGERFAAQVDEAARAALNNLRQAEVIVKEATTPGTKPETKPVKADVLARQFRSVIESIQREAQQQPEGDIGVTLKTVDVEVKGLIVVEGDSAAIVTPTPDRAVDPGQLSTIRLSYGSVPLLRTAATTPTPGTKEG